MSQFFLPGYLLGATLAFIALDSLLLGISRRKLAHVLFAVMVSIGVFSNFTYSWALVVQDYPTQLIIFGIVITALGGFLVLTVAQAWDDSSSPDGWYFGKVYIGITGMLGTLSGIMTCLGVTGGL